LARMSALIFPPGTAFRRLVLEPDFSACPTCGGAVWNSSQRRRRFYTLDAPIDLHLKLARCKASACPGSLHFLNPLLEMQLAPKYLRVGWDVLLWLGFRRFKRHLRISALREELADGHGIVLSDDAVEKYVARYQVMVATRQTSLERLLQVYALCPELVLTIDGLQPEVGHETLYCVRELRMGEILFAEPLLCGVASEVQKVLERTLEIVTALGKPVSAWISDKQNAFVTGIAKVFPGVAHRYCANHFLRDAAAKVLADDSRAKVELRRHVRGLRHVEQIIQNQIGAELIRAASTAKVATHGEAQPSTTLRGEELEAVTTQTREEGSQVVAAKAKPGPRNGGRGKSTARRPSPPTQPPFPSPQTDVEREREKVVLKYCAATRGILSDNQGGPLRLPGLRMTQALQDIRDSLKRCLEEKKGGAPIG
jgi:hypothetical protein